MFYGLVQKSRVHKTMLYTNWKTVLSTKLLPISIQVQIIGRRNLTQEPHSTSLSMANLPILSEISAVLAPPNSNENNSSKFYCEAIALK